MNITELLKNHPHVAIAVPDDNEAILSFFDSFPMQGEGMQLQYKRGPDFFQFLKFHSMDFFVFLLKDKDIIQGVGTLILQRGFIRGAETTIGYLGDLRVKQGKKNALIWRNFYQDLIAHASQIDELKGCHYFITAVIDSNKAAQTSLVNSAKTTFSYHLLSSYQMANIYWRLPWSLPTNLKVRRATETDRPIIEEYFKQKEVLKEFGHPAQLGHALNHWPHFNWSNFILVFDSKKLVGLTATWSPSPAKKIVIRQLPMALKFFSQILKIRPSSFPSEGEELRPLYLTHLNFDSEKVLTAMINFVMRDDVIKHYHMLSLAIFSETEKSALKNFICDFIPMGLYQVYHSSNREVKLNPKNPPGFEMALV